MNKSMANRWARRKKKFHSSWDKLLFNLFMRARIKTNHQQVIADAEAALEIKALHESDDACLASPDPLVRQGWALKKEVESHFKELYAGKTDERILIQVPAPAFSPAGYSLFSNLAESLEFIGVPTRILAWEGDARQVLEEFRPTVLLSSDHESYLSRIDWNAVAQYKVINKLRVGLTASLEEYANTPLKGRLDWAREHGVDFFYTFRDEAYVQERVEYRPFFDAGYKMVYLPFGANILHYYPVAGFNRDLDFVLMASRKSEHMSYMKDIVRSHAGFIGGPGWRHVRNFSFNRARDRYIYARAKVGLNVHLPEQIEWACEVNERTYQLAACGVPQLVDHPKLLDELFSRNAVFVADTPAQYTQLFRVIMRQPELAQQRALLAQKEVFARHTTFHRSDWLMLQLKNV
jgi:hypothetical protein